jgi:hypothetical protein
MFRNGRKLGHDLRAVDVQRNRDHGLASYNDYRVAAKLPKAVQWQDFADLITPEVLISSRNPPRPIPPTDSHPTLFILHI